MWFVGIDDDDDEDDDGGAMEAALANPGAVPGLAKGEEEELRHQRNVHGLHSQLSTLNSQLSTLNS